MFATSKLRKSEKHCDHVSIKKVFQSQHLPATPPSPFLRFLFAIANLLVPPMMEGRWVGFCYELTTCNMILIICVFLNLSNLNLTRKHVTLALVKI